MKNQEVIHAQDRILVLGLGVSGTSAANYAAQRGARVVAADERPPEQLPNLGELHADVETRIGKPLPDPRGFDCVIPSPGIARERYSKPGVRALGDIEIAWRALAVPVIAVTGTNGKTTTVALIEALLRRAGIRASAAGNIGKPALSLVGRPLDVAVLEVSSFQMEATEAFAPRVAVVLNLAPDHLDRHGDLDTYARLKRRMLEHQKPSDTAVLNADDSQVVEFAAHTRASILHFSGIGGPAPLPHGVWWDSDALVLGNRGHLRKFPLAGFGLPGPHNVANAAAAMTALYALGADLEKAAPGLGDFAPLAHRCEIVHRAGGVTWVNDSKATNVGAVTTALRAYHQPIIWIAGGRDKGHDFTPLADAAQANVREALLIGEAATSLAALMRDRVPTTESGDLERAVARAASIAEPGDVVLLSPGCASFDQFRDYEDRGDQFRKAVLATLHDHETST